MTEDDDLKDIISQETVDINLSDMEAEKVEIEEVDMDDIVEKKLSLIVPILIALYLIGLWFLPFPTPVKGLYFILLPTALGAIIAARRSAFTGAMKQVATGAGIAGLAAFAVILGFTYLQNRHEEKMEAAAVIQPPKIILQQKESIAKTYEIADLKSSCKNKLMTIESKGFTKQDKKMYESLTIGGSTFDQTKSVLGDDFTQLPEIDTMRAFRWDLEGVSLQLSFKDDVLMYIKSKPRYIGCDFLLRDTNNLIGY